MQMIIRIVTITTIIILILIMIMMTDHHRHNLPSQFFNARGTMGNGGSPVQNAAIFGKALFDAGHLAEPRHSCTDPDPMGAATEIVRSVM